MTRLVLLVCVLLECLLNIDKRMSARKFASTSAADVTDSDEITDSDAEANVKRKRIEPLKTITSRQQSGDWLYSLKKPCFVQYAAKIMTVV